MGSMFTKPNVPSRQELEQMHALYRKGGEARNMAPHVVYPSDNCPHDGCLQKMQAIDFRLEFYGPAIHDPLVRAWWNDTGFAGQCPLCGGWIHFTIGGKQRISAAEAASLPQLPDDWHATAVIL